MTAEAIAQALGGRKAGSGWIARCPAHDDHEPSLSIATGRDGVMLVFCHAGCDQSQVIAALRTRGLWSDRRRERFVRRRTRRARTAEPSERNDAKRSEGALRLWAVSLPIAGTLAETYLRSRGLHLRPPATLRFHSGLKHPTGDKWPAMVGLVTRGTDNAPIGIHRTFLARNGAGKALVKPQKMMLGPCRGGAIRLGNFLDALLVGEGIETCLAAMQSTGRPVWAALSTSGLRTLDLPQAVHEVTVLADGDDPGEAAAQAAARRWKREGRVVRIARPPRGLDFNDLLLGAAPRNDRQAA